MSEAQAWHLRGNWKPLHEEEKTHTELVVEGSIPPELNGVYMRTGPNPSGGVSPHWFLGDGMLHGIRLENGKVLARRTDCPNTQRHYTRGASRQPF